ncbi:MoxR family ATPase [Crocosphaera sp.]|uniref:AAA family ATPase n=1 Tax=Crocosphaera sp. TaxID=2729996 RepID=UPI00261EB200|nr:MoxR family ATPase [Crocosphaera sp.]MDJ0582752.1 MoxR family ATPase [Crocosphaera sp.]
MAELLNLTYRGTKRPSTEDIEKFNEKTGQKLLPYLPSKELVEVVNWAIKLERPLLLKGEPGCGKTQLALAVVYELNLPFEPWYIKSTSSAKEGLYTFDNVARLRDAQLAALSQVPNKEQSLEERGLNQEEDMEKYIQFGALGKAFQNQQKTVVLIDEIDKADLDFPNDLLLELDQKIFEVKERKTNDSKRWIKAKNENCPIVFITSNDEKDLPDAFLRRCLFHYLKFPDEQQLIKIIEAHLSQEKEKNQEIIKQGIKRFIKLRNQMEIDKGKNRKKVSTSELLDWVKLIIEEPSENIVPQLKEGKLPFAGVLLKSYDDCQKYGIN